MEHLLLKSKCSSFYIFFKYVIFQGVKRRYYGVKGSKEGNTIQKENREESFAKEMEIKSVLAFLCLLVISDQTAKPIHIDKNNVNGK